MAQDNVSNSDFGFWFAQICTDSGMIIERDFEMQDLPTSHSGFRDIAISIAQEIRQANSNDREEDIYMIDFVWSDNGASGFPQHRKISPSFKMHFPAQATFPDHVE